MLYLLNVEKFIKSLNKKKKTRLFVNLVFSILWFDFRFFELRKKIPSSKLTSEKKKGEGKEIGKNLTIFQSIHRIIQCGQV